jgi:acetolactate synthase-1/2/3 large subunit
MARKTLRVETVAQAYLELLRERGIDVFIGNAGTDFASLLDGFARFAAEGKTTPRPILVTHEHVALSMAHGYYLATGRPQVVMVHVTVGTANALGAVMNAARSRTPVLFTAGRTPLTEDGSVLGARDTHIHWAQEAYDQAGMLREFVKWDYELRHPSQLEAVVDRALELATADPAGPVYLTLPREVLAEPLAEVAIDTPSRRRTDSRRYPDPARLEEAAEILAGARAPLVIVSELGRTPEGVAALAELADAGALAVIDASGLFVNLPDSHPCHAGYAYGPGVHPAVAEADAILVVDSDVPWFPAKIRPPDGARVIQLAVDPFFGRLPMRSFPCDVPIAADPVVALPLLAEALRRCVAPAAVAARRARLAEAHRAQRAEWAAAALAERALTPIGFRWASRCVAEAAGPDTVVVNEYPLDRRYGAFDRPGSYLASPHAGGLGWALGTAVGVKLGAPGKTVIATVGDGSYVFGVPTAAHWAAWMHGLPILTVVFNNRSWDAVKGATLAVHPKGWAAAAGRVPLSDLTPSPRFEEIVRAFDGHGERVEDPAALPDALARALKIVREERRQALLNVVCHRHGGRG